MRATDERVLLIVDFKNQLYRAAHTHAALFSGRKFTGGLYGFIISMLSAVREIGATDVVVATDTPPYARSRKFECYKNNRKKDDDEAGKIALMKVTQSTPMVLEFLQTASISYWAVDGFEFDDICAWAVNRYQHRFDRIIAQTNDSDLYQLFEVPAFGVYKGNRMTYTREHFVQEWGDLSRDEWITLLCLTGTHNAVPGIAGVGPATAKKALRDPVLMRQMIYKHLDVINRNRTLIELPHADFPADPALRIGRHQFEVRDCIKFFARYEIQPTAKILEALQDLRYVKEL